MDFRGKVFFRQREELSTAPKVGTCTGCLRNSKEATGAGVQLGSGDGVCEAVEAVRTLVRLCRW